MTLLSAYGEHHKTGGYNVVDASNEDGVSATLMGGGIQTFNSIVTDKTFADIETSPTKNVDKLQLAQHIPPNNGGSQRIKIVMHVDQLLNPESLQVRIGWKLMKLNVVGAAEDVGVLNAITGGVYCVRMVALHNASMAGGGKVVNVYNRPRAFPVSSMLLAVPITGS